MANNSQIMPRDSASFRLPVKRHRYDLKAVNLMFVYTQQSSEYNSLNEQNGYEDEAFHTFLCNHAGYCVAPNWVVTTEVRRSVHYVKFTKLFTSRTARPFISAAQTTKQCTLLGREAFFPSTEIRDRAARASVNFLMP